MSDFERGQQVVELLKERSFASVRDLQELLGISAATARRDIDKLHDLGFARKVYGGISALEGPALRDRDSTRPYDENRDLAVDAKRAIAALAATLVRDGDSIIVHGGSTCFELGTLLATRNIRLYTNSMPLAAYVGEKGSCSLTVAGGDLYREPGIIQRQSTGNIFFASKCFFGAQGLSKDGLLESNPLIVQAMQELSEWSDEIIILADSRKFSLRARSVVVPLTRIGAIITDDGLTDTDAKYLEEAGITIHIAQATGPDV
ncbi:DeoR/GlpR transcriptional regulator (plasmid) [Phyllobacterium sp. 628]|uniref:DeoR/GlpR family DNA-binding transcription regulator n=1 Tax=Phyllobacterium sp. 628 TaxID=2718938 RepID=UPI0016622C36|nr:DeoR/GlpR family DNA-binding transcription regulator [Phyllobacterium sp. 628]QND54731.1 DeoR/GlpR transcriptional regulator [Phyllobacterium sp. 628]